MCGITTETESLRNLRICNRVLTRFRPMMPHTKPTHCDFPTSSRHRVLVPGEHISTSTLPTNTHEYIVKIETIASLHISTNFTMAPNWDRLIRFVATDGRVMRGTPILPSPDFDVGKTTEETGLKAKVIDVKNNDIFDPATKVTDEEVTVKKLLGPVTTDEVPIIRCIGLNYIKHSKPTLHKKSPVAKF
jgi:hypothetical protein